MKETYNDMIEKAISDLKNYFVPGAFDWLEKTYPGYNARLTHVEKAVNDMVNQNDVKKFRESLKSWYSLVRRGLEEYRAKGGSELNN